MIGSQQVSAQQLVNLLQEWIGSAPVLSVQAQLLSVDMNCAVAITSFAEPECQTESTTQETNSTRETSIPLELIVGIVLGVLLIVVLSVATVVVIIVVVLLRRSKKAKVDLQAAMSQE